MQVHREHNQVRSARIRCSSSAGSKNSIHSRGKSSETSRIGTPSSVRDDIQTTRRWLRVRVVRLGVLDVGSNTVHLLVVDAHRGAQPTPQRSRKAELKLAEHIDDAGRLSRVGADALVRAVAAAKREAKDLG